VSRRLTLKVHTERYAIVTLPPEAPAPAWAQGRFTAVLHSDQEWTVVCDEARVPGGVQARGGWRCLEIVEGFTLDSVGVVAAVTRPIAEAGISLFAYSTWRSDCLFVQDDDLEAATAALTAAGHVTQ
jgi:hypothetical protein